MDDFNKNSTILNSPKRSHTITNLPKAISFDKLQGGTLILGGDNNVNGDLAIENAAGQVVVNIDTTGIAIKNGNIVIFNDSGQVSFDGSGIRSTANFASNQVTGNPVQTTTNTTYTDVTGSSFTISVTKQTVKVLFNITTAIGMSNPTDMANHGYQTDLVLYDSFLGGTAIGTLSSPGNLLTNPTSVNSTDLNLIINFGGSSYSYNNPHSHGFSYGQSFGTNFVSLNAILSVGVGTHNYKLQFKATGGTAQCDTFIVNYVILGF